MIEQYLRLKKKGLTPTVALVDVPPGPMSMGETKAIELTMSLYDPETGQVERQQVIRQGINEFLAHGKEAKKKWIAFKDLYEALSGGSWPND